MDMRFLREYDEEKYYTFQIKFTLKDSHSPIEIFYQNDDYIAVPIYTKKIDGNIFESTDRHGLRLWVDRGGLYLEAA